jgi:exopolysaccharide production protein ExoZ
VVFFHAIHASSDYHFESLIGRFFNNWGQNGVDIFFVISGFIMAYIQHLNKRTAIDFFIQRIKRIVPIYWFCSFFIAIIYFFIPEVFNKLQFNIYHFLSSLVFLSNFFFNKEPLLVVGWTLEYEFFFYLLFALSLFFKKKKYSFYFIYTSVLILVFFGIIDELFIEFLFGMLIALIYIYSNFKIKHILSKYSYIFLIFGTVLLCLPLFFFFNFSRYIQSGIPSSLILLGLIFSKQLTSRVLVFLGKASYSIYLTHIFVVRSIFKLGRNFLPTINAEILIMLTIIISLLFGLLIHLLVENRFTKIINSKRN